MPVARPAFRWPPQSARWSCLTRWSETLVGRRAVLRGIAGRPAADSPVLAAILRNTNSYGLQQPPRLGADEVAKLPVSRLLDTDALSQPAGRAWSTRTRSGHLRVLEQTGWGGNQHTEPAGRLGAARSRHGAHRRPGRRGNAVQPPESRWRPGPATSPRASAAVRQHRPPARCSGYPTPGCATGSTTRSTVLLAGPRAGHGKTVEALGLNSPALPIPWSVLSLFAAGPDAVARRCVAGARRPPAR